MDIKVKFSQKLKIELYKQIMQVENPFGEEVGEGIIQFLSDIWDLNLMKSNDSRYKNALGEFVQHLVNNDDYSYDYLFQERLDLYNDDDKFLLFIETFLSPKYRKSEGEILGYVLLIKSYLEEERYTLVVNDYNTSGLPIYKVRVLNKENVPADIKPNDILFDVEKNPSGRNDFVYSHTKPKTFPSFVLVFNNGWNDFSVQSLYYLFYYNNENDEPRRIGKVKIIHKNELCTNDKLPDMFTFLSEDFCSLGQEVSYYNGLKDTLNNCLTSVLFALRDVAYFPDIHEEFERNRNFRDSLIRYDSAERLLREARHIINGYDLSGLYSFKYHFKPPFSKDTVDISFEFSSDNIVSNRIYALIGKNGTGKTQLITSLPQMIYEKNEDSFTPRAPLFSKIIAVSYSIFDRFNIPKKTSSFNYYYCGLRNDKDEQLSEKSLVLRFHNSWKKIAILERINKWRKILLTFIDEEFLNQFLVELNDEEISPSQNHYKVDVKGFNKIKEELSSGQAILLYIITEIVANIRYDSLLLYDEPEIHLHPNAITQLINTIYELVEEFQSYCIIATHSPLIVRELFSKNVYIFDREDNSLSIRRISVESFGENLSVLTEEIFGNKGIPKQHKKILEKLVREGLSYEKIISMLEFDEIPLSLNARIYIKTLLNNNE